MDAEIRFHIEMEAERLMREERLSPAEARRLARVRFGGVEKFREAGRDARGSQWIDALSLDGRLAIRMLVKHRWLTLVGGFAMAVAIAIVATVFEFTREVLDSSLPIPGGDRIVALQYATSGPDQPERRLSYDFVRWRTELASIEQLSAFRSVQHNLVTADAPEPVKVAEMTASAFALAGTPPLMGRYLVPQDEREGAPRVIVIGHEAWRSRCAADPRIVGRTLDLAGTAHEVVGVMPAGFRFPLNHQFWIPLRVSAAALRRWQGPSIFVFGRLAPGATAESAQAELAAISRRVPFSHPQMQEQLRPLVLPYTREHLDLADPSMVLLLQVAQFLIGALCLVVAVNLAVLMYARTATRLGEIAVRTALGASRRRILSQLFLEALALTVAGAAAGLMLARVLVDPLRMLVLVNNTPFWVEVGLSWPTAAFAFALAVISAAIVGVVPGMKATGRQMHANLQELNGRSGTRLGPMWTGLVIAQVAVAVAVLPVALFLSWQVVRMELSGPGFAAEQFVVATLAMSDDADTGDRARFATRQSEMIAPLRAEPGVTAVTFSSGVPGFAGDGLIQLADSAVGERHEVEVLDASPDMFAAYDATIIAGRGLESRDFGAATTVVVNETFARRFFPNRSPLDARFRYARQANDGEWHQIVGVVRDFPRFSPAPGSDGAATIYHAADFGDIRLVTLSVRFAGPIPAGTVERIRQIGAAVDPSLQLRRVVPLSKCYDSVRSIWRHLAWGIALATASVLLLSAAGVYALMSFTVAQRRREIGIRVALGAHPQRLLAGIFGRVLRQLAIGVLVGSLLSTAAMIAADLEAARAVVLLIAVAAVMSVVGMLAALGPARRSLHIPAMEALRNDG